MAVPNSGPLGLRAEIGLEVYGNVTGSDISLHQLAQLAEFSTPDEMGEFYGYTSVTIPVATADAVSNVSGTSFRMNGSVTNSAGDITARGFYYATGNRTVSYLQSSGTKTSDGTGAGSFNRTISASASTTYSYCAYGTSDGGEGVSASRILFTTLARYTFTVTFNGTYSPLHGTFSSTVDQGQTAGVGRSASSPIGRYLTNNANSNASGQYNAFNNFSWGTTMQKVMNANASGTITFGNNPQYGDRSYPTFYLDGATSQFNNRCEVYYRSYYHPSQSPNWEPRFRGQTVTAPGSVNFFSNYSGARFGWVQTNFNGQTAERFNITWFQGQMAVPFSYGLTQNWQQANQGTHSTTGQQSEQSTSSDIRLKTGITYL